MSNSFGSESFPLHSGGLTDALSRTQIYYDYFTPNQIRSVKPTFLNEGNLALKGMIHSLEYDSDGGMYTAKASLGNVAAHDNIREVAGVTNRFGFKPPKTFSHDFGGVYTKYYPRIDKSESFKVFDLPRPDASIVMYDESHVISEALALRLNSVTTTLARAIIHGVHPADRPLTGGFSGGFFIPQFPEKIRSKSEYDKQK